MGWLISHSTSDRKTICCAPLVRLWHITIAYCIAQNVAIEPTPTGPEMLRLVLARPAVGDGAEHALLYPGSSDVHLSRDHQGIIHLDAEIPEALSILVCPSNSWTALRFPV